MKTRLRHIWDDFIALLFPRLCIACEQLLPQGERCLCIDCQMTLPETDFHKESSNIFKARFDGRVQLEAAAALFFFTQKSRTQHLVHQIKYHDKREAAIELGRMMGNKLVQSADFQAINCIIPVPMHPTKQRQRGYNQAEMFAEGLADSMHLSVETKALQKMKMTTSQTKMTRLQRLANTQEVFQVVNPRLLEGKNLLIVDDVMTSGATLESCAAAITKHLPDAKISFATIAYAQH